MAKQVLYKELIHSWMDARDIEDALEKQSWDTADLGDLSKAVRVLAREIIELQLKVES